MTVYKGYMKILKTKQRPHFTLSGHFFQCDYDVPGCCQKMIFPAIIRLKA